MVLYILRVCYLKSLLAQHTKPSTGQILCRLLDDSKEISELGRFMRNKLQSGYELYFIIQEEHRGQHAKQVSVSIDVIEQMIRRRQFKMNNVDVQLSTKLAYTEILLHLGQVYFLYQYLPFWIIVWAVRHDSGAKGS